MPRPLKAIRLWRVALVWVVSSADPWRMLSRMASPSLLPSSTMAVKFGSMARWTRAMASAFWFDMPRRRTSPVSWMKRSMRAAWASIRSAKAGAFCRNSASACFMLGTAASKPRLAACIWPSSVSAMTRKTQKFNSKISRLVRRASMAASASWSMKAL